MKWNSDVQEFVRVSASVIKEYSDVCMYMSINSILRPHGGHRRASETVDFCRYRPSWCPKGSHMYRAATNGYGRCLWNFLSKIVTYLKEKTMLLSTCLRCDVHSQPSPGGGGGGYRKLHTNWTQASIILVTFRTLQTFLRVCRNKADYHVPYLKHSLKDRLIYARSTSYNGFRWWMMSRFVLVWGGGGGEGFYVLWAVFK